MGLRHLRYLVAVAEEEHYGRASRGLRVAQPALSRQIQDLEEELGFKLLDRLPRGVKLNAGKVFLEDARRVLQAVGEATARAARVARGQAGTLRVGFAENASWHGAVPDSFRRFRDQQPDVELQLQPAASLEQLDAIRSGRLDAGFVNFMAKFDRELDQLAVAVHHVELAVPKRISKRVPAVARACILSLCEGSVTPLEFLCMLRDVTVLEKCFFARSNLGRCCTP